MIVTPFSRNSSAAAPREQMSSAPISVAEDCEIRSALAPTVEPYGAKVGKLLIDVLERLGHERHGDDLMEVCNYIEDHVLPVANLMPGTLAHEAMNNLCQWCIKRSAELDEEAAENGAYVRDANGHYGVGR